jgi:hypothetical protein
VAGLSAAATGLVVLVLEAVREVLSDPGLSLVDGYWIGRLPWTAVGVALVVLGATTALAFGAGTAWLAGGWARRLIGSLALAGGALWWLFAMLPPPRGAFCATCPPPGPDPLTMAYSLPEGTVLFLLLPASVAALIALTARRGRRSPAVERLAS